MSRTLGVVLLAALLLLPHAVGAQNPPTYDIVVRNGRVLDGAGNPWILADVAVRDGRIVRVGAVAGQGRREIDAEGLYVAPGFIDMMDQSGSVLPRNPLAENKLRMGVTSAIGGRGRDPRARRFRGHLLPRTGGAGDLDQLRKLLLRDADPRRRAGDGRQSAEPGRIGAHARAHGDRDARWCHGHDDGPDLPALGVRADGRARGGCGGRRGARRHLREPHPGRGSRSGRGRSGGDRNRRAGGPPRGDLPLQGGVRARMGHHHP